MGNVLDAPQQGQNAPIETSNINYTPALQSGGGAISGISESFSANPATGTSSLSVPLPFSPARQLSTSLSLTYDSGSGNSAFGVGWSVNIESISRKTSKGLPSYTNEDVFVVNGGEDLVPMPDDTGEWRASPIQEKGKDYKVLRYRLRTEGAFSRFEQWTETATGLQHWRIWSGSNTASIFGQSAAARIAHPGDPTKTFRWFVETRYDGFGNVARYRYKREDHQGVDLTTLSEQHRAGVDPAGTYLKSVHYGNRTPYAGEELPETDFCFITLFDYGEHDPDTLDSAETRPWARRDDPFSTFRAGFEQRHYRLCQRVIKYHQFEQLGPAPEPVSVLGLTHDYTISGMAMVTLLTSSGCTREQQSEPLDILSHAPITLDYQALEWGTGTRSITVERPGASAPGTTQTDQWADLFGTGLPGLLSTHDGALTFQENLGDGTLAPSRALGVQASLTGSAPGVNLQDLGGEGTKSLVLSDGAALGFYELDTRQDFAPFRAFPRMPSIPMNDPNLRMVELDGDGIPDLLYTDGDRLVWYKSKGKDGFEAGQALSAPVSDAQAPSFVFSDPEGMTFLADMSGDGLVDVARIQNGAVTYWPNLGRGRFGTAVQMDNAPLFGPQDGFNPAHIKLADVDGNGVSDILHFGQDQITVWRNQSGNSWADPVRLGNPFGHSDLPNAVSVVDVFGTGTACLRCTSQRDSGKVDCFEMTGGIKPYLLSQIQNGTGGITHLSYRPSTHYAQADARAGSPWITQIAFPVHCLAKVEKTDQITGLSFASSYTYHHGYFDPFDREFRGFGRVDQYDSEHIDSAQGTAATVFEQPPILSRTWYHTGAFQDGKDILSRLSSEFYTLDGDPLLLPTEYDPDLSSQDLQHAYRALKGTTLRQEIYALDGTDAAPHPYSITMSAKRVVQRQASFTPHPHTTRVPAVFQVLDATSVTHQLDRNPAEVKTAQALTREWDAYGNVLQAASLALARATTDPTLPADIQALQATPALTTSSSSFTAPLDPVDPVPDHLWQNALSRHLPKVYEASTSEVTGVPLTSIQTRSSLATALDALPEIAYGATAEGPARRRLSQTRTYFLRDDLSGPLGLGQISQLALSHRIETLSFDDSLITDIYGSDLSPDDLLDAKYVHSTDEEGAPSPHYWAPSATSIYTADAPQNFYLAAGVRDPFGNTRRVDLDNNNLLVKETFNALDQQTLFVSDYRTLGPKFVRDLNGNWGAVAHDALGRVSASAQMGKVVGDQVVTGREDCQGDNLNHPSQTFTYEHEAWHLHGKPVWAKSTRYTEHHFSPHAEARKTIEAYEYTDGFGNVIMTKSQATPGIAQTINTNDDLEDVDTTQSDPPGLRWVGNGRTVFNNKGQPLKQYEPYFSETPEYETDPRLVETGQPRYLFYDALGRAIGTLNPDHTWTKAVIGPWHTENWDQADTCLMSDPAQDPVLGNHFSSLPGDAYLPSWIDARYADDPAVEKSTAYANTPMITHQDALGREVLQIVDNGEYGLVHTRTQLDIEGNTKKVTDNRDNAVMSYAYSIGTPGGENGKSPIWENSMDAGVSIAFHDVLGRAVFSWNALGFKTRTVHDALNRVIETHVTDPQGEEICIGRAAFADALSDAPQRNLLGHPWRSWDQSGFSETLQVDFKGNILQAHRQLCVECGQTFHWPEASEQRSVLLSQERFEVTSEFDALGRLRRGTAPSSTGQNLSETRPTYNARGGLDQMQVGVLGAAPDTFVKQIEYDAKGQRQFIRYGNDTITSYTYDPITHRLTRLKTERLASSGHPAAILQDISYSYDVIGNIIAQTDAAQQTIYFNNREVPPTSTFTYDATYRLIEATGREHSEQAALPDWRSGFEGRAHPEDGRRMRPYTQLYAYDSVGNILTMQHLADGAGWTRTNEYEEDSNRLDWTEVGAGPTAPRYSFDYNDMGAITGFDHLEGMGWNHANQLTRVDKGSESVTTYAYDATGQRVRKRTVMGDGKIRERLYFGMFEIYREIDDDVITLERESLHVSDDTKRIALVETQTIENASPVTTPDPLARYQYANHLGSAALELDAEAALISYEEYHPYGTTSFHSVDASREVPPKRYRYTGKERDEESGFTYHGARYYAPWLARWIAADPIGIGDGVNLYMYVGARPIGSLDPTGNEETTSEWLMSWVSYDAWKKSGQDWVEARNPFTPLQQVYENPTNHGITDSHAASRESVGKTMTLLTDVVSLTGAGLNPSGGAVRSQVSRQAVRGQVQRTATRRAFTHGVTREALEQGAKSPAGRVVADKAVEGGERWLVQAGGQTHNLRVVKDMRRSVGHIGSKGADDGLCVGHCGTYYANQNLKEGVDPIDVHQFIEASGRKLDRHNNPITNSGDARQFLQDAFDGLFSRDVIEKPMKAELSSAGEGNFVTIVRYNKADGHAIVGKGGPSAKPARYFEGKIDPDNEISAQDALEMIELGEDIKTVNPTNMKYFDPQAAGQPTAQAPATFYERFANQLDEWIKIDW